MLNVGKKSVMNQYLNDALADSLYHSGKRYRDDHHHPYITDVVCAGSVGNPSFDRDWLSTPNKWIEGCKHLSQSLSVKRLLADAVSKQFEEESGDNRNKTHRSLSCGDEKSRLSSVSCSSEHESKSSSVISSREGCLDKCIKNITIMDLSTAELANGKSVWLAKEIRGVRKKLNQIAKLHEAEERSIVLSTEQRAKVDRRPVLDAELYLYESALEDAEKRIRELSLEEQDQRRDSKLPKHFFVEENGPNGDRCPKDDHNENGKEPSEAEISLLSQKKAEKSYTCQLCSIKCPDETSFELHENGRKHRNRVLQVAEEEKKKVAASIMEQHQLEQLKSSVASPHTAEVKNAWGVPSAQPKYKLPPPPHPAAFPVPSSGFNSGAQGTPAKSSAFNFRKILGEESGKTKRASVSPVWATPKAGSTSCVPLDIYAAPSLTPPEADGAHRNSYSLVDFLAPKPIASPKIVVGAPWSSQHTTTPASMKSLADIQAEETDFKTRQDKSYEQGGGTWFIERKERADSFQEIQLSAKKEREENLLIQEQFRIEAQIKRDLAMERESEKKQKIGAMKRSSKGRNTNDPTVRSNRSTKKERSIAKGRNQDGNKKEGKTRNTRNYGHGPKKNKPQQS